MHPSLFPKVTSPQCLTGASWRAVSVYEVTQMIKEVKMEKKKYSPPSFNHLNKLNGFHYSSTSRSLHHCLYTQCEKNSISSVLWWGVPPAHPSRRQACIIFCWFQKNCQKKLHYNAQHSAHNRCSVNHF